MKWFKKPAVRQALLRLLQFLIQKLAKKNLVVLLLLLPGMALAQNTLVTNDPKAQTIEVMQAVDRQLVMFQELCSGDVAEQKPVYWLPPPLFWSGQGTTLSAMYVTTTLKLGLSCDGRLIWRVEQPIKQEKEEDASEKEQEQESGNDPGS